MLSGCSSLLGIGNFGLGSDARPGSDGSAGSDTPVDHPPDTPPNCLGVPGWELCFTQIPSGGVALTGNLSTNAGSNQCAATGTWSWTTANQPDACVVAGGTITISGTLTATGSRPLVLAATDTITIATLVVAANDNGGAPGAPASTCGAFATAPGNDSGGAGGGAGGSFVTAGGNGGTGDAVKGIGGTTSPTTGAPTVLRAGCEGQRGGQGTTTGANPGHAGGAVYVVARNIIAITGAINASGSGGDGGNSPGAGGAGGGTGGSIVLDAPTISAMVLVANGAGGGGGASQGGPGNGGNAPSITTPLTPADGGNANGGGNGKGGAGYANQAAATVGQSSGGNGHGGGGGGGGGGYIRANTAITGATASPRIDIVP
jgi:hypothetical protein